MDASALLADLHKSDVGCVRVCKEEVKTPSYIHFYQLRGLLVVDVVCDMAEHVKFDFALAVAVVVVIADASIPVAVVAPSSSLRFAAVLLIPG